MLHNKDIAIISPVTLINIGLKQILTDYFSAGNITVYTDTEYFKTFFKYDAPDISQRLLDLLFTGESDSLEIKDYSFNKEKKYKVIHPEIVKEYAHLNSM